MFIERTFSLLLVLGLLLPPLPLCLGLVDGGDCSTGGSCCCGEPDQTSFDGPSFSAELPGSGGCACEATASLPAEPQAFAASDPALDAPLSALGPEVSGPVALVDWSLASVADPAPSWDVRTRPPRITAGVRLI